MPGQRAGFGDERVEVEGAVGGMGDDGVRHAAFADERGQRAGVDAGKADDAAGFEPGVEPPAGPEVRRLGEAGAKDRADRSGGGGRIDDFDVLVVDADDADMRESEGDDLGGVGGVGQDLLVAGHGGIEADFADRRAGRPDAEAFDGFAACEREHAGGDARAASRGRRGFANWLRVTWGCA